MIIDRLRSRKDNDVVGAAIVGGNLILRRYDGSRLNVGAVGGSVEESWFFSYMVGFSDGVGGPAAEEHFDWSGYSTFEPTIVGTDLRLNPLDHTEVEVLTEGDYVICIDVTIRSDEDPTSGTVNLGLEGSITDHGWGLLAKDLYMFMVAPFGNQVNHPWTTPPIHMLENDTIKIRYTPNIQDGAVTPLYGEITVKRIS